MKRVNDIINHPVYQEQYRLLCQAEKERPFCRHTMEHFLDVARLMYIYNLEEKAGIEKEIIYAASLLHDIGRYEQIARQIPHNIAGAHLAGIILGDCGFDTDETKQIQDAIKGHRIKSEPDRDSAMDLTTYLYRADKQSRMCFSCGAFAECKWAADKKNMTIIY
jgi:uncharacterized protein